MSEETVLRTVVVDPATEVAGRIAAALGETPEADRFRLIRVDDVATAAERFVRGEADLVLLPLPGPEGSVSRLLELRAGAPDAPVVVLAPAADEAIAIKAVQLGATDHLVTERLYGTLLVRCLRHAVEVERVRSRLRGYDAEWPPPLDGEDGSVPGTRAATLREALPDDFAELVEGYGRLLDRAVEQTGRAGVPGPDPAARRLALRAGGLRAGPRDLVEIHAAAMSAREGRTGALRMKLFVAEGRVRLLEVMGHLVSYYRDLARPGGHRAGPGTTE